MQRIKYLSYLTTAILFAYLAWVRVTEYPSGSSGLLLDATLALILLGIGHQIVITLFALLADVSVKAISLFNLKMKPNANDFIHSANTDRSAYADRSRSGFPLQRS
jgi:uncharacterized protein (DUF3820 family)